MTDHDHTRSTDSEPTRHGTGSDDRWVRAHHLLGDAGVKLNEAHAHLATLQNSANDEAAELTAAEANALAHVLEDARDELNRVIEIAGSVGEDETPRREPSRSKDSSNPDEQLYWNSFS